MKYSPDTVALFAFSLVRGVGIASLKSIAEAARSGKRWDEIQIAPRPYLKGSAADSAAKEIQGEFQQYVDRAQELLHSWIEAGIGVISILDVDFPAGLKQIEKAPVFLYFRGNVSLLIDGKGIAIIGTRQSTSFGESIAKRLAQAVCARGYTVVSGLAHGIDAEAHRGALSVSGKTIAVLVNVAEIYPHENQPLAKEILEKDGLLVAENPPGTQTQPRLFVDRDRIQSGLSFAVFPIETAVKGGTMHTVRFAREQGKWLLCLEPSELYQNSRREYADGINWIVKEGGTTYTSGRLEEVADRLSKLENSSPIPSAMLQQNLDFK